jgi:hypothetical protein
MFAFLFLLIVIAGLFYGYMKYVNTCSDTLLKTNDVTRCSLHAVQNMQRDFTLKSKAKRDYITEAQFEYIGAYDFNVCDRVRVELHSPLLRRSGLNYELIRSPENGDWVLEHDKKKNLIVLKTNNYGKTFKRNTSLGFDVYPALPNDLVLQKVHVEERY